MTNDGTGLEGAVRELTKATQQLHEELRDNYPKRGEVERKYVTKFSQQRVVIRLLLGAILLTVLTFVGTIGSFAVCLVGDNNPGFCKVVPGYKERIDRRNQTDYWNAKQEREIARILKRLDLRPIKPEKPLNDPND